MVKLWIYVELKILFYKVISNFWFFSSINFYQLLIKNESTLVFDTILLSWVKKKYRYCLNKGNILDFDEAFSFSGAPFDEKSRHFGRLLSFSLFLYPSFKNKN